MFRLPELISRCGMVSLIALAMAHPGTAEAAKKTATSCTVNGKTYTSCTPAQQKQAARQAARQKAAPQKKGVTINLLGVSKTTASSSTLAPTTLLAAGATAATMAIPNSAPDYFGVGNYANSTLPVTCTGDVTVDPPICTVATTGYPAPAGPNEVRGIRKFVDPLPDLCNKAQTADCIPVAAKDTSGAFPGSDYYKIGLKEFQHTFHRDLPPTAIRGYYDASSASPAQNYLGPVIIASRNVPVRVLFKNEIATDLNIPTDTTYMGAGMVQDGTNAAMASQKRAVVHLHGGNTPWISDGTTHQWITPAGGDGQPNAVGFAKGFSFQNVPDMVGAGKAISAPSLTDGFGTYYWTNEQSGRLMFYHDHAYGLTRLNVYAGEAAGYLLIDPVQEDALATTGVPGLGSTLQTDLARVVPLVIQDKTFVPDSGAAGGQLAAQDPTWDVSKWPYGSLWYPHVYMPNQNPADSSGANGFGRWDYGPWFWPPQNPNTFVAGGQPYACTSSAYPTGQGDMGPLYCPGTPLPSGVPEGFMDTPVINGKAYPTLTVDPTTYRFHMLNAANDRTWNLGLYVAVDANNAPCDIATNPSPAPETTGAACTEVKMVQAIPALARTIPDCTDVNPMGTDGIGLALFDANGEPLNGTGLPLNNGQPCWPQYTNTVTGPQAWPTDARDGGVPDPALAGPPFIKIGTEGGLLPKAVVIPSTPVNYDYNRRSITVLNVLGHGLYLGAAERSDVVVDFSKFAGKTLIVYNDAPAPVPAGDPRLDYYTGDPDNSGTGGAPSTQRGFGPNTRTIMQIKVNATCSGGTCPAALSVANLTQAIPSIFATTQDPVIVPETAYPAANGGSLANNYARIQDTSMTAYIGGGIGGLTLTSGGAGYTSAPSVTIAAPTCGTGLTCTTATATASLSPTSIASYTLTNGGGGYTSAPAVTVTGGGGSGATATTTLSTRSVASVSITNGGNGYTSAPTVTFSAPPTGTRATGTATVSNRKVVGVVITNAGSGYTTAPTVTFTNGGGSGAAATSTLAPTSVASINLTAGGSGYTSPPTVTIANPASGTNRATASANLTPTVVANVTVTNFGSGYRSAPSVTFDPPQAAGTAATAVTFAPTNPLLPKTIQELFTLDYGRMNATLGVEVPFTNFNTQTTIPYGYSDPATEIFKDGETQLWKITHNGVDTHFIHFHLFTVQVINRVGWDGAIKPPGIDEMSFKDTVRMNPLEDVIVALRPFKQTIPFPVPNSRRPMDVTLPVGQQSTMNFGNIDPANNPAAVTNSFVNFGWEYVWHCHILGHEENDMMRPMIMAVAPTVPTVTTAPGTKKGTAQVTLTAAATNTTSVPTGFTVQRATAATGPYADVASVAANVTGTTASASFADTGLTSKKTYFYRAVSNNRVGYTQTYAAPAIGYPNTSADSSANPTNGVSVVAP